jgi:xylose isomerase
MADKKSYHSICRWTFNPGKGGFVPADTRPAWNSKKLPTAGVIGLIKKQIAPRLPDNVELGFEVHYDAEIDEKTAPALVDALADARMHLAMVTPGAHSHFAYGGVSSLDAKERAAADKLGARTVDLAYGALRKAWHPDPALAPSFVIWNGSFGYDVASVGVDRMYQNLKESVANLARYEQSKGGSLFMCIEPKPNEGHPAMLLPTVASAIVFWNKLNKQYGIDISKKGVNKEFGHSEMIGLDHIYDTVEELDNGCMVHMHINSQGYNDGIILGGPGKYDIDHGARINGMNIAIAGLLRQAKFNRWKGHDMQVRAYDDEAAGVDRVVRSVLSWEACEQAAKKLETKELMAHLEKRHTAKAEDMMRDAVVYAHKAFNKMYKE